MIIILDTNILGLLTNPNQLQVACECQIWFQRLLARGIYFVSSELCFYEVKRGLVLAQKKGGTSKGINKINDLRNFVDFLEINQRIANLATEIWAQARLQGKPTADEKNIDVDIIIAAHWQLLTEEFPGRTIIVSTTNIKHLDLFTNAQEWQNINY